MAHDANTNLARRRVRDAERRGGGQLATATSAVAPTAFVPLTLPRPAPAPTDIRIELRRSTTINNVRWPCAAASACAVWLRELLR